jgi:putative methyltransferase (TIGR04325 family)
MKQRLIQLLPDKLFLFLKGYGWYGNFKSWQEAKEASTGYDAENILHQVKTSLLKVKNGDAVYERDSVLFDKIEYSWELLAALMWIAAQNKGELHLIDFGGSLGSSYYQNKSFLDT